MADAPKSNGKPALDDQGKDNAAKQASAVEAVKADQQVRDPLQTRPGMTAEEAMAASPNHLLLPDPLPALNRPIFEAPRMGAGHPPMPLHPDQPDPVVEAAIEGLRTRLGELREYLKRFHHHVGGDLGKLVHHLRISLSVPTHDPAREAERLQEDRAIAERRRHEDTANNGLVTTALATRRSEEDAGLAVLRRIQDTPV